MSEEERKMLANVINNFGAALRNENLISVNNWYEVIDLVAKLYEPEEKARFQDTNMFGVPDDFVNQRIERFGTEDQIDILQEECAELIQACSKLKREIGHFTTVDPIDNLKEELAHVAISSAVVSKILDIKNEDIENEIHKKAVKYNFRKDIKLLQE